MKLIGKILAGASLAALLGCASAASAHEVSTLDVVKSSAPADFAGPYDPALACVSSQLTPAERMTTWGVQYFVDRTGKEAYAPENASGKFLSQGAEDMLITSLMKAGVSVVELNGSWRSTIDWLVNHELTIWKRDGLRVELPDISVSGSFDGFDTLPGHTDEVSIAGIGGGLNRYEALIKLDARATWLPGKNKVTGEIQPAGTVIDSFPLVKRVVGYENKLGLTSFFGSKNLYTANIDHAGREPIQYIQGVMLDLAAYKLVTDTFHITVCEPQRVYGDQLVAGMLEHPKK